MIVVWLTGRLADLLAAFFGVLPALSLPAEGLASMISWVTGLLRVLNVYVPVTLLGACVLLVLAARVVLLAWNAALFVYHQFWGGR